jgi:transcriptional regulator with GAF, ATPase, and Fis domain
MKNEATQSQVLLSLSDEIVRIRGKQDMLDIILHKLKKHIRFDDSFIMRYDKEKKTCRPYIYYSKKARSGNPEYETYLAIEYPVYDDAVNDINLPVVYDVETVLQLGLVGVEFMHKSGIKEFVVIKLIESNQLLGLFVLLSEHKNSFKPEELDLLLKLSYQISTATANIIANEEIAKNEEEKTILLSLSHEIGAVRNKTELLELLNTKLPKIFPIVGFGITLLNENGKTHSPYVVDVELKLRNADFNEVITLAYAIDDGVFNLIVTGEEPVQLQVDELADSAEAPAYVQYWKKMNVKRVLGIAIQAGNKNLGCFILLYDPTYQANISNLLFKGVTAQVSIAISNIRAIEEIIKREEEKSTLLSISQEIAVLRDRNDIFEIVIRKMKELFSLNEFGIGCINNNDETYSSFTIDLTTATKSHEDFDLITSAKYSVHDPIFSKVMNAEEPVDFDINDLSKQNGIPQYVNFWKALGFQKVLCVALRVGRKNIGCTFLHYDSNPSIYRQIKLIKGVCAQLSVAISNILAAEEINEREAEKTILLSLSNEISLLNNRNDLLQIVNKRIKKIFSINELAIAKIDDQGKSYSAFMLDLGEHTTSDVDFKKTTSDHYNVMDALFSQVMNSDDPIIFNVNELISLPNMPEFVHFWKKVGFQRVLCAPLRAGGNNIGMAVFHIDTNKTINPQSILLKGICAQLSVAISNIVANEKIQKADEEKALLLSFSNDIATVRDKKA